MSKELPPNGTEVVVINDCRLNDPEGRTLGNLTPGDRVVVNSALVDFLVEQGLVAPASDFPDEAQLEAAMQELKDLDAQLKGEAQPEGDEEPSDAEAAASIEQPDIAEAGVTIPTVVVDVDETSGEATPRATKLVPEGGARRRGEK